MTMVRLCRLEAAVLGLWFAAAACGSGAQNSPAPPAPPAQTGGAVGTGGARASGGAGGGASGGAPGAGGGAPAGGSGGSSADAAAPGAPDSAESTPADASAPADPSGKTILMVAGTSNGTAPLGQGIGDKVIKARLTTTLGHKLVIGDESAPKATLVAAAEAADMVLVVESVSSVNLLGKLKDVTKPILSYEAFIQDDMGLTAPGPPGDPGEPKNFALGVKDNESRIDIVDPAHPLAAGLSGTVTVYSANKEITWGTVAKTAEVVATLPGDAAGASIYVYRKGVALFDGTPAAGLRIGFFLEDDDKTGTPNFLTPEGLRLFDAAVKFALSAGK